MTLKSQDTRCPAKKALNLKIDKCQNLVLESEEKYNWNWKNFLKQFWYIDYNAVLMSWKSKIWKILKIWLNWRIKKTSFRATLRELKILETLKVNLLFITSSQLKSEARFLVLVQLKIYINGTLDFQRKLWASLMKLGSQLLLLVSIKNENDLANQKRWYRWWKMEISNYWPTSKQAQTKSNRGLP